MCYLLDRYSAVKPRVVSEGAVKGCSHSNGLILREEA